MKKLAYSAIAGLFLLSSCSTYQINTVRSTNTKLDEKTGEFKFENDSVKIIYSFAGDNAPIHLDIFNKLNEPVYADWSRSAFINDGKSYSYADQTVQINGDVSGASIGKNITFSNSTINAQATLPQNVVFVPPHSQITKTVSIINKTFFHYIPDNQFVKTKISSSLENTPQSVKIARFDKNSSPLLFKSYLTLYTLNGNTPKFTAYQNDFYVSEITRVPADPSSFSFYQNGRGDFFTGSGGGN